MQTTVHMLVAECLLCTDAHMRRAEEFGGVHASRDKSHRIIPPTDCSSGRGEKVATYRNKLLLCLTHRWFTYSFFLCHCVVGFASSFCFYAAGVDGGIHIPAAIPSAHRSGEAMGVTYV